MSQHAIITGALFRKPEQRQGKSKPFAKATVRVGGKEGESSVFWNVLAFNETAMGELDEGDVISAQGALKVELYQPEGSAPKINHTLFADQLMALKQPRKAREPKQDPAPRSEGDRDRRSAAHQSPQSRFGQRDRDLDDDIPF
jgi:hypothetical protein